MACDTHGRWLTSRTLTMAGLPTAPALQPPIQPDDAIQSLPQDGEQISIQLPSSTQAAGKIQNRDTHTQNTDHFWEQVRAEIKEMKEAIFSQNTQLYTSMLDVYLRSHTELNRKLDDIRAAMDAGNGVSSRRSTSNSCLDGIILLDLCLMC